jgi:hypothetical protein
VGVNRTDFFVLSFRFLRWGMADVILSGAVVRECMLMAQLRKLFCEERTRDVDFRGGDSTQWRQNSLEAVQLLEQLREALGCAAEKSLKGA